MRMTKIVCSVIAGAMLLGTAGTLRAEEDKTPSVAESFKKLSSALEKDPNISPETKKALKEFGEAVAKMESKGGATQGGPSAQSKVAEWFADEKNLRKFTDFFGKDKDTKGFLDRFTPYGDFRLRFEDTTNAGSKQASPPRRDRVRYRARLRVGTDYEIAPQTAWLGARLVTGDRVEQQSANQTFGDDFSKWQVNLDRLYMHWEPFGAAPYTLSGATKYDPHVWAGKFQHPFKSTNLMWLSDVQPEGLAVINSFKNVAGFLDEVQLNGASYILTEDADRSDSYITAGQLLMVKKFSVGLPEKLQLSWAESFYKIHDTHNDSMKSEILNNPNGNFKNPPTATAFGTMQSEYELIDSLIELRYNNVQVGTKKMPLIGTFDYIYNVDASVDRVNLDGKQNKAYEGGVALGDPKKKGDWRVGGDIVHSERDGVFKPLTNDDWAVNNNFKGLDAYFDYAVWDNVYLRLWALWDSPLKEVTGAGFDKNGNTVKTVDQVDHFRFRVEFNVKF